MVINFFDSIEKKSKSSYQVAIIATKPTIYENVLSDLKNNLLKAEDALIISILAGIKIDKITNIISDSSIVRAMPNIAVSVFDSMTALIGNEKVTQEQISTTESIFESVGEITWLKKESQMDSFTAISGSGPAYFFYLMECIVEIAIEEGFEKKVANKIARQLILGSGNLLKTSSFDPKELRDNVTSPNGTTEEAFKVLIGKERHFYKLLNKAIKNAKNKSEELGDFWFYLGKFKDTFKPPKELSDIDIFPPWLLVISWDMDKPNPDPGIFWFLDVSSLIKGLMAWS